MSTLGRLLQMNLILHSFGATQPPLESTLIEVFILRNLNLFRMNTYEKHGGWGVSLLTTHPMRMRILSERSESKDLSSHPTREIRPEEHRDGRPVPTWSGRFRACRKGSLFTSQ